MKIIIDYESSWRNSFLDGSNNEELPKTGRKFIGSMTSLRKTENYINREVSIDTVMGILNRLIGEQRKLYQARNDEKYFFKDIESCVKFEDKPTVINTEMTYIRNITGSTDQNSYTGMIKSNDKMFKSDYSKEFWGVLDLDFDELYDFVINDNKVNKIIEMGPISIISKLELIKKEKPVVNDGKLAELSKALLEYFNKPDLLDNKGEIKIKPYNNKGEILILPLYCSALYIQLDRLSKYFNMESARAARGGITGISNNGFTVKNIMDRFTTGRQKIIWGNPYARKEFKSLIPLMKKVSGTLDIEIEISREKAKEINQMIKNAGVSSFYLGKKGLAYVSRISTKEVSK